MTNKLDKVKFVKDRNGERCVLYKCPHCKKSLSSHVDDVALRVVCPLCEKHYIVPGLEELEARRAKQKISRTVTHDSFMASEAYAYGSQVERRSNLPESDKRVTTSQLLGGLIIYFIFWPIVGGFLALFFLVIIVSGNLDNLDLFVYCFCTAAVACLMHTITLIIKSFKASCGR